MSSFLTLCYAECGEIPGLARLEACQQNKQHLDVQRIELCNLLNAAVSSLSQLMSERLLPDLTGLDVIAFDRRLDSIRT